MGKEIERKFLVNIRKWKPEVEKVFIRQGYLCNDPERTVRIRIVENEAFLTIKGISKGITRNEFNYPIPVFEAEELIKLSLNIPIEKYRYKILFKEKLWEVDEFTGENKGLFLAEIELESEDEQIEIPPWIDKEVSEDKRYFNSYLSQNPISGWDI
ncbi:MAG: CYTH domain-containing protein [Prolixibacteraceae bacterium]|nr:CYTH domain-containing protein [Prolixibacteraceae bacterium]MBN2774611.1 CYTH domain-containing protein [Prolixibacteraceae bacterium]